MLKKTAKALTKSLLRVIFDKLALVDGSDSELSFDCSDERRPLEQSSSETLQGLHRI